MSLWAGYDVVVRTAIVISALILWSVAPCNAQELRGGRFQIWCAGTIANGHVFGFDQDRKLSLCSFEYSRRFFRTRLVRLDYRVAAVPFAMISEPSMQTASGTSSSGGRLLSHGAGASPVGIAFVGPRFGRVEPSVESLGGFLYFNRRVLSPLASQFNFTIDLAPSLTVRVSERTALRFGYRYLHMSNANITAHNPGVDTQMIFAGIVF